MGNEIANLQNSLHRSENNRHILASINSHMNFVEALYCHPVTIADLATLRSGSWMNSVVSLPNFLKLLYQALRE
jgi:hypothetical protein